jgi:hypothetical protein
MCRVHVVSTGEHVLSQFRIMDKSKNLVIPMCCPTRAVRASEVIQ